MRIHLGLIVVVGMFAAYGSWSPEVDAQGASARGATVGSTGGAQLMRCPPTTEFCAPGTIDPPPVLDPDTDACGRHSSATLVATPPRIRQGQSATLQWSVTYPYPCTPPVITVNGQPVGLQGSLTVTPMSSSPYALFIGGVGVTQVNVYVDLPAVVRIKGNTGDWKRLLIQALGDPLPGLDGIPQDQRAGRTVLLAHNVDMDLTYSEDIHISQGVTLTSELPPPGNAPLLMLAGFPKVPIAEQGPVARNAFSLGPRLYTTSRPRPLLHIQCNGENIFGDRARLSGFRIQGPHFDTEEGDDNLERALMITSCTGVEISNMEISGWSGQAIYISDPAERISKFEDVKVVHNFIHHNQHQGGNGYGVETTGGAMATIERNLFDFNRHAIAAGGGPGVGYRANKNLVLKGGGHHDTFFNEWTHQFDVHGDDNCYDIIPFYEERWWNCGNAGDAFQYIGNTFQYTSDLAIKIRGTPRIAAEIHHNVFARDDIDDAVAPTDNYSVSVYSNFTGTDDYGQYGVCDFDADGRDDLFLATGVTWWYSSAGRREWIYLNERPEKLSSLGLGDFDGDGRCDVFAVHGAAWDISKGGTSVFTPLGTFGVPFNQLAFGDFNGDGRKDIFRRAPDGQWFAISPGVYPWTALQSSSFPLSALRFGDFDGNGVTDVLGISGGKWSVSWDARSTWQPLNPTLSSSLASVFIGNVDGVPGDDIIRYVRENAISGRWDVSSGGAGPWTTLTSFSYPDTYPNQLLNPAAYMRTFVGRFDVWNGSDLLALEYSRGGRLFSAGHANLAAYGLYAY
jgi:hypothetical protein